MAVAVHQCFFGTQALLLLPNGQIYGIQLLRSGGAISRVQNGLTAQWFGANGDKRKNKIDNANDNRLQKGTLTGIPISKTA